MLGKLIPNRTKLFKNIAKENGITFSNEILRVSQKLMYSETQNTCALHYPNVFDKVLGKVKNKLKVKSL